MAGNESGREESEIENHDGEKNESRDAGRIRLIKAPKKVDYCSGRGGDAVLKS